MKKTLRTICTLVIILLVFSMYALPSLAAETTHFTLYGHQLSRGIQNVQCNNAVDSATYPHLYAAINLAISDWDWHLSLLNDAYSVNWNLTHVDPQTNIIPEITFVAMNNIAIRNEFGDNIFNQGVSYAFTAFYDQNGARTNPYSNDWYSTKIVFCVDILAAHYLNDVYALKQTANHEIGHALGLDHHDDHGVIMYPKKRRLHS